MIAKPDTVTPEEWDLIIELIQTSPEPYRDDEVYQCNIVCAFVAGQLDGIKQERQQLPKALQPPT